MMHCMMHLREQKFESILAGSRSPFSMAHVNFYLCPLSVSWFPAECAGDFRCRELNPGLDGESVVC